MSTHDLTVPEAERQVVDAADRYREVMASMDVGGRPETGQRAAVKAVGRSLQLLTFVLKRAAAAGVPLERLGELTTWQPELVQALLERPPEPALVSRVSPPSLDAAAVAQAAASVDAEERVRALVSDLLADIEDDAWSPAAADLDDLHDRLESTWRGWRLPLRGPGGERAS